MHFSHKILGLNAGIFGTIFGQSGTYFWIVLCAFFFFYVLLQKLNNMLVV